MPARYWTASCTHLRTKHSLSYRPSSLASPFDYDEAYSDYGYDEAYSDYGTDFEAYSDFGYGSAGFSDFGFEWITYNYRDGGSVHYQYLATCQPTL